MLKGMQYRGLTRGSLQNWFPEDCSSVSVRPRRLMRLASRFRRQPREKLYPPSSRLPIRRMKTLRNGRHSEES